MPIDSNPQPVATERVAAVWPQNHPGTDPVLYGHVSVEPSGAFEARSTQTFTLIYTVGRFGIDDLGAIRIVFRIFGDWGLLQTDKPTAPGYVSAETSGSGRIDLRFDRYGHGRPFNAGLTGRLHGGYLREGDTITLRLGDSRFGSPGMKLQTFCESAFEFKTLVDVCATGHFVPLPLTPTISIVPGDPLNWRALLPSLRRPGEPFHFGIKCEDRWGNPSDRVDATLQLRASAVISGLPQEVSLSPGQRSICLEGLRVDEPGERRIEVILDDRCVARAGPLQIRPEKHSGYWADMHGQSGESIGINTAREYFEFARHLSFLDATGHQANDFQINNAFWQHVNELSAEYNQDHRFVTLPGYEWSGNTAVGGDRNIYFRTEGRQIRRSSHALIEDRSDIDTDANDARKLFAALQDEDCIAYAHVGGRYADVAFAHDGRIEKSMEIHSAWGTFEWLLTDGFALGHRCGVVCNSDGHKGRPGASYPGAATFGAYGGLTCFLATELTRDGLFECLRRRHHYGTTGCRLDLQVAALFREPARRFEEDPNCYPAPSSEPVTQAMMGDIVEYSGNQVDLEVAVHAGSPIEMIEFRNGTTSVARRRSYTVNDLGSRLRVVWSGAEYRGRGRQTTWLGSARFHGARIDRLNKINAWNHERQLEQTASHCVEWEAITTGNFGGFDVWLDEQSDAHLELLTNHGQLQCALADIGYEPKVIDAGGLARQIRVYRMPDKPLTETLSARVTFDLHSQGDNPLWVCVTTEDGFQAWSSPIFVFRPD